MPLFLVYSWCANIRIPQDSIQKHYTRGKSARQLGFIHLPIINQHTHTMKKAIIALTILLAVTVGFAQEEKEIVFTDLDIANALIAQKGTQLNAILQTFHIDYWITGDNETGKQDVFIQYNNSVRLWQISTGSVFRTTNDNSIKVAEDIIIEVFIRYRHSNLNDLRDFFAYLKPHDTDFTKYEKEPGAKLSHFRIKQH